MKKVILTIIGFAFLASISAQLKVSSNGNVGIGCEPGTSRLWIKGITNPSFTLEGAASRLQIGVASSNGSFASFAEAHDIVYRPLGKHGLIFSLPNTHGDGNHYIKFGDEANGGWFSIFNNRTVQIDGRVGIGRSASSGYALDVNGIIRSSQGVILSDERLKRDIKPLSDEKNRLYLLQGRSYKKAVLSGIEDVRYTEKGEKYVVEKRERRIELQEYGYLAQELEKIFPDLVSQDSEGHYSVNYIGLIPLIVEALKEQKNEIEKLKGTGGFISLKNNAASPTNEAFAFGENISGTKVSALYQNVPNPFSQATRISYYLPETVTTAHLCFYDLQGKQLRQIALSTRGEGVELISGSQFSPGIYLYALIADGQEVDVKRMILTE